MNHPNSALIARRDPDGYTGRIIPHCGHPLQAGPRLETTFRNREAVSRLLSGPRARHADTLSGLIPDGEAWPTFAYLFNPISEVWEVNPWKIWEAMQKKGGPAK